MYSPPHRGVYQWEGYGHELEVQYHCIKLRLPVHQQYTHRCVSTY